MAKEQERISISEMAKLHRISRQTLIHYDKVGLFKPEIIQDNGYRYYSLRQVPVLREICFLRSLDVPVEDIKSHLEARTPASVLDFFSDRLRQLDSEIEALEQHRRHVKNRLNSYKPSLEYPVQRDKPALRYFTERRVIFVPYAPDMNREKLHYAVMQAWRVITAQGYQPSNGFGSLIRHKSLRRGDMLAGAGAYIALPKDAPDIEPDSSLVLPAGNYVTMFKYGMPYDTEPLQRLLAWMDAEGYQPCGDVVDACIFDTTFYDDQIREDFCQLQVPVSLDDPD